MVSLDQEAGVRFGSDDSPGETIEKELDREADGRNRSKETAVARRDCGDWAIG
jgi:hypothetical protein